MRGYMLKQNGREDEAMTQPSSLGEENVPALTDEIRRMQNKVAAPDVGPVFCEGCEHLDKPSCGKSGCFGRISTH